MLDELADCYSKEKTTSKFNPDPCGISAVTHESETQSWDGNAVLDVTWTEPNQARGDSIKLVIDSPSIDIEYDPEVGTSVDRQARKHRFVKGEMRGQRAKLQANTENNGLRNSGSGI